MSAVAIGTPSALPVAAGLLAALSAAVAVGEGGLDLAALPRLHRDKLVQRRA
jgi:hypothetical protein